VKWESIKVPWDFWHPVYELTITSPMYLFMIQARVYWDMRSADGWYYGYVGKVGLGVSGPFKTQTETMENCERRIYSDLSWMMDNVENLKWTKK
jgi:hypothetical protein